MEFHVILSLALVVLCTYYTQTDGQDGAYNYEDFDPNPGVEIPYDCVCPVNDPNCIIECKCDKIGNSTDFLRQFYMQQCSK